MTGKRVEEVCCIPVTTREAELMQAMDRRLDEPMRFRSFVRKCEFLVAQTRHVAPEIPEGRALQLASEVLYRKRLGATY